MGAGKVPEAGTAAGAGQGPCTDEDGPPGEPPLGSKGDSGVDPDGTRPSPTRGPGGSSAGHASPAASAGPDLRSDASIPARLAGQIFWKVPQVSIGWHRQAWRSLPSPGDLVPAFSSEDSPSFRSNGGLRSHRWIPGPPCRSQAEGPCEGPYGQLSLEMGSGRQTCP